MLERVTINSGSSTAENLLGIMQNQQDPKS